MALFIGKIGLRLGPFLSALPTCHSRILPCCMQRWAPWKTPTQSIKRAKNLSPPGVKFSIDWFFYGGHLCLRRQNPTVEKVTLLKDHSDPLINLLYYPACVPLAVLLKVKNTRRFLFFILTFSTLRCLYVIYNTAL